MIFPGSESFTAFSYEFLAFVLLATSLLLLANAYGLVETRENYRILQELYDETTQRHEEMANRRIDLQVAPVLMEDDSDTGDTE